MEYGAAHCTSICIRSCQISYHRNTAYKIAQEQIHCVPNAESGVKEQIRWVPNAPGAVLVEYPADRCPNSGRELDA
jgi:hypothetical protein